MQITGSPLVKLSKNGQDPCPAPVGTVPPVCSDCRQFERWMTRTHAWTAAKFSRFKNIMSAILRGHDEILASLCGSCGNQVGVPSCDCLVQQFIAFGYPLTLEVRPVTDACLFVYSEKTIKACPVNCLEGCILCLDIIDRPTKKVKVLCRPICDLPCVTITLDPCNNPLHLDVLIRSLNALRIQFNRLGTGPNILAAVAALFPGTTPALLHADPGVVYIDIGRNMTHDELTFLEFYTTLIPIGFNVKLEFIRPA